MRATILALLVATTAADARPRVAQTQDRDRGRDRDRDREEDSDGPEASAVLPINLDDLIEVAIRLSPDAHRAKIDRVDAGSLAALSGQDVGVAGIGVSPAQVFVQGAGSCRVVGVVRAGDDERA